MSDPQQPQDDGLIIPEVGSWAKRKYHFLARYLDMFSTGMKNKWPERHYIDLFASAGIAKLRGSEELVYSSALLAAKVKDPFTHLHYCEKNPEKADALYRRLTHIGAHNRSTVLTNDVNNAIDELLEGIPAQGALSVAFADPYGLHLDYETVRTIAAKRCDLIILLADNMDALRNWATYYMNNPKSSLDRFMGEPGWRDILEKASSDRMAQALRERYEDRLRALGYEYFAHERVRNSKGTKLYTLVFASAHPTGLRFWRAAAAVDEGGQRKLFE